MNVRPCNIVRFKGEMGESDEFTRLDRELTAARNAYRIALDESVRLEKTALGLPSGHPDGTQLFRLAHQNVKKATERYQAALNAYVDYGRKRS